jgi:hypothetical protein
MFSSGVEQELGWIRPHTTKGKHKSCSQLADSCDPASLSICFTPFSARFSHMLVLVLICLSAAATLQVMSTTVLYWGARRTWTSLRALLFLETRRPLQIGRKPFATRSPAADAGVQGCRILTTDSTETVASTTATAHVGFELEGRSRRPPTIAMAKKIPARTRESSPRLKSQFSLPRTRL